MSDRELIASATIDTYRCLELSIGPDRMGQFPGEPLCWNVFYSTGGNYVLPIQVQIEDRETAAELARHLFLVLEPEWRKQEARRDARDRAREQREEEERPAREEAARKAREERDRALAAAEPEAAAKCTECGHVDSEDEFDEPYYECGRCGQGARGDDGRRCSGCNIFCAKQSDTSCPSCEQPTEPEEVIAKYVGNKWWEDEESPLIDL